MWVCAQTYISARRNTTVNFYFILELFALYKCVPKSVDYGDLEPPIKKTTDLDGQSSFKLEGRELVKGDPCKN